MCSKKGTKTTKKTKKGRSHISDNSPASLLVESMTDDDAWRAYLGQGRDASAFSGEAPLGIVPWLHMPSSCLTGMCGEEDTGLTDGSHGRASSIDGITLSGLEAGFGFGFWCPRLELEQEISQPGSSPPKKTKKRKRTTKAAPEESARKATPKGKKRAKKDTTAGFADAEVLGDEQAWRQQLLLFQSNAVSGDKGEVEGENKASKKKGSKKKCSKSTPSKKRKRKDKTKGKENGGSVGDESSGGTVADEAEKASKKKKRKKDKKGKSRKGMMIINHYL